MNADNTTVPTNAADETDRVNEEQAGAAEPRGHKLASQPREDAPHPLSTEAAHQNFQNLQADQSVAVDQRVPSGPLNPTVTANQPVTDPARNPAAAEGPPPTGPDQNEAQTDVPPNPEPSQEGSAS